MADSQQRDMFYQRSNGSTTLPRDFRFHHQEERPTTPEPMMAEEPVQPSPPRPARLKVKRRHVSCLQAPTEQFLASVAAADIPVPTIEIPSVNISEDLEMADSEEIQTNSTGLLAPQHYSYRASSPPRTPIPGLTTDEESSRRPDWYMSASSPDDYFQRPTSSLSNTSDFSDDSFYSGGQFSRPSEDGSCTSPDSDVDDPFQFPSISKAKGKAISLEEPAEVSLLNGKLRRKTRKDAPWTKAMNAHLWSTYLVYLQDPTVTPFRIGASSMPPEGVCHRVAREAGRSWKGPTTKVRKSDRLCSVNKSSRASKKSGSVTPTEETPKVYTKWPHSSSTTRSHLRELCRSKDNSAVQRHRHFQSRSPTPFTKSQDISRLRVTPEPRGTSFNTKDIALSLTTSTSETMHPNGPLASLATEGFPTTPTPDITFSFPSPPRVVPADIGEPPCLVIDIESNISRSLGSPFMARTYGPSSSQLLCRKPSSPNSDTAGPRLRSPLRFENPRSLNTTQKRRAQHSLEEELNPSGGVFRPSILDQQLFGTPLGHSRRRVRSRGFSLGDEALRHRVPGIFQRSLPDFTTPRKNDIFTSTPDAQEASAPALLPSATFEPPRLGSPFSESGPNQTFPRRLFQDSQATVRRGAFATMHQSRHSIESFDFAAGPSLQSRLGQLDTKLKEIREREEAARR